MEGTEDGRRQDDIMSTAAPVQPLPSDVCEKDAIRTSPHKPEVEIRSPAHEMVKSPETAADASPHRDIVGVTCDKPASPVGAAAAQEQEQDSSYRFPEFRDVTPPRTSSYFGESHVTRLQSFVDSVAAGDEVSAPWSRRVSSDAAVLPRGPTAATRSTLPAISDLRKPTVRRAATDEPLDLSLKSPSRRLDPSSLPTSTHEIPFPVVPPPLSASQLFPLLACRESWIAHWAALAAASLQHSMLFPTLAVTSPNSVDTSSGHGWQMSTSPRSSSSSSPSISAGNKMADERRRTALTAMESFVESSFKQRQQQHRQTNANERSHLSINRKRRRHLVADMPSSGDEDAGSRDEKQHRLDRKPCRTGNAEERSESPKSNDLTQKRDDVESRLTLTSLSKAEVSVDPSYLPCSTPYDATEVVKEHPLVSLEKFVGTSAPLFRSSVAPPSAAVSNGISSPVADRSRTRGIPDEKVLPEEMTSSGYRGMTSPSSGDATTSSRSMRVGGAGDLTTSGSLGHRFTPTAAAQSLVCCNL